MEQIITPNDPEVLGKTDAESIQNAIDRAAALGLGRVVIPRKNARTGEPLWRIGETVLLPDDMTVILEDACLRLEDGVFCNIFRNRNAYTQLGKTQAGEQKNIRILGRGKAELSGGNHNGLTEETGEKNGYPSVRNNNFILFSNVRDFEIRGLRLRDPRWWAVNLYFCRHGHLADLDIYADDSVPNQDGLDLRCGCNNIIIENITGQAGDDLVALTALRGSSEHLFAVEGRDWDIHSVILRNIKGTSVSKAVVALRNQDGVRLYNVLIDGLMDTSQAAGCRPYATLRIGQNTYVSERPSVLGETFHIHAKNIFAGCDTAVMLCATLENCSFRDTTVGGTAPCALSVVEGACLRNILVDGVYYSVAQPRCFTRRSQDGDVFRNDCGPDNAIFHFNHYGHPLLQGQDRSRNVVIQNVYVAELRDRPLVSAYGDAEVTVRDCYITRCESPQLIKASPESRVRLKMDD